MVRKSALKNGIQFKVLHWSHQTPDVFSDKLLDKSGSGGGFRT